MRTIYKYIINMQGQELDLPNDCRIIKVSEQNGELCMWVDIDTDNETTKRNFQVFGTGHEIPRMIGVEFEYVGTGFFKGGYVFHLYERTGYDSE